MADGVSNQYGIYLNALNSALLWQVWSIAYLVLLYSLPKKENRAGHYTSSSSCKPQVISSARCGLGGCATSSDITQLSRLRDRSAL